MQHLSFLLFQLDEARRYILDGRAQHLRLAFLLLDNAAEIQMDRRIKDDLNRDDFKEQLKETLLRNRKAQAPPLPKDLQEIVDWIPLTRSEKHKLDRFFDEKIAYMVGRGGHISASLTGPLKHLHKYRNEAYHRAEIRPETIHTAALILLEINCQLLLTVYPGDRMMSSAEDYSWLEDRFGYKPFLTDEQFRAIVDEIRSGLLPTDQSVVDALAGHLHNRFAEFDDLLDFIDQNSYQQTTKEELLKECQLYAERKRSGQPPTTFVPKHTLHSIQALASQISDVRNAASRLDAFDRFASIEKELEPVEECVSEIAGKLDEAIQLAVDVERGK